MAATAQAPIKNRLETKDRIRYLAAFEDASQAEIVEAVAEYAVPMPARLTEASPELAKPSPNGASPDEALELQTSLFELVHAEDKPEGRRLARLRDAPEGDLPAPRLGLGSPSSRGTRKVVDGWPAAPGEPSPNL